MDRRLRERESSISFLSLSLARGEKRYPFKLSPFPHIIVTNSRKELHGWYPGKRECTAERLLINPYAGCFHNCAYCYAKAFPGYFELFRRRGIATVFENFPREVARQLDSLKVAACGYLSPVTDPFNPLNDIYKLSEEIINIFVCRNLPIEFITKGIVSDEALELISQQRHSFGQISLLTVDSELHRTLSPGAPSLEKIWENFSRMREAGVPAVLRIDPIIPFLTDSEENISLIMRRARELGVKHVIVSSLDIPLRIKHSLLTFFKRISPKLSKTLEKLYVEKIGPYLHADIVYRRELFSLAREIALRNGLSFALCMEFYLRDGKPRGLNEKFMTSNNCEGIDIPLYGRKDGFFEPLCDCLGNCLNCSTPLCGISEMALKKSRKTSFTLRDYRRFGRILNNR
jgi:DNA repair photolyase